VKERDKNRLKKKGKSKNKDKSKDKDRMKGLETGSDKTLSKEEIANNRVSNHNQCYPTSSFNVLHRVPKALFPHHIQISLQFKALKNN
jgi:hypothetical protein